MKGKKLIIDNEILKIFSENEKAKMKNIYQYILIILIIFEFIILFFYLSLKKQKEKIILQKKNISNEIYKFENEIKSLSNKINLYMVNLQNKKITDIIANNEEYFMISNWINNLKIEICFKGTLEGDFTKNILDKCLNNSNQILILIELENGKRFGGYFNNNLNKTKENYSFLFSLNKKKKYDVIKENNLNFLKEDNIIKFDEDLIINSKWKIGKKNLCNFPKNYGDEINDTIFDLNGGLKHFDIIELEFFSLK